MAEIESDLMTTAPYLSDVIVYDTDIEPHKFICLWSGVGSGKNKFVARMITGDEKYGIPQKIVLVITSRKSKVIELLNELSENATSIIGDRQTVDDILWNTSFDLEEFEKSIPGEKDLHAYIYQRSVICTNAFIEKYHQYRFDPSDPTTHLWNRFDVIVWDEPHSLVMDSSYQSAPYHVMRLLNETYKRIWRYDENLKLPEDERDPSVKQPLCQKIILMSGTPEPLAEIRMPRDTHLLDMRTVCKNVTPRNLHFLDRKKANEQIGKQLQDGERVIYFVNHTPDPEEAAVQYGIPAEKVAVSFSNEDKRKQLKDREDKKEAEQSPMDEEHENHYQRMQNVETYMSQHSSLRPDISLFLTTSKNKEGINIEDKDIRHVYIEAHGVTDIRQMAGRVRHGAEHVYIVMDSVGHNDHEPKYERWLDEKMSRLMVPSLENETQNTSCANMLLDIFCQEKRVNECRLDPDAPMIAYCKAYPEVGKYIDEFKKKFPYLEYDFQIQRFAYNHYRKLSKKFAAEEKRRFEEAAGETEKLTAFFQEVFPETNIHPFQTRKEQGASCVEEFLQMHPANDFSAEEIAALVQKVNETLLEDDPKTGKKERLDPNRILHKVGYDKRSLNNNKQHPNYYRYKIVKWEATPKVA